MNGEDGTRITRMVMIFYDFIFNYAPRYFIYFLLFQDARYGDSHAMHK